MQTRRYRLLFVIGIIAIVIGGVFWQPTETFFPPEPIQIELPIVEPYVPPDVTPYLDNAKLKSDAAIEQSLQDVQRFFNDAKRNSQSFAEAAMSFGNKAALMLATGAVAFYSNPEPFLDGMKELVINGGEVLVRAVGEEIAKPTIDKMNSIVLTLLVVGVSVAFVMLIFRRPLWKLIFPKRKIG